MIAVLLGCPGLLIWWVNSASEAEKSLHAVKLTAIVFTAYVDQTGKWPTGWDDLLEVPETRVGMWRWPNDHRTLQQYVETDFGATWAELTLEGKGFDAIRPREASYPGFEKEIADLRNALRSAHSKQHPQGEEGDGGTED